MKKYLKVLPFKDAKVLFQYRTRMFPTKDNFKERFSKSLLCNYCCNVETDVHLFECCGYMDLVNGEVDHKTLMSLDCDDDTLQKYASILSKVYTRLSDSKEDKELNDLM